MFKILLLNNKSKICHSFFSWKHTEHFSNFYLFWILQQNLFFYVKLKQFWNNLIHGGFLTEKKFLTCWTSTESEFAGILESFFFVHQITELIIGNNTLFFFYKQHSKFPTRLQFQIFNSRCLWPLLSFQKNLMIVA